MNNVMENISVLISKYLKGTASADEQSELGSVLEQNTEARDMFTEDALTHQLMVETSLLDRGAQFKTFMQAEQKRKGIQKTILVSSFIVAAGVAAFVGFNLSEKTTVVPVNSKQELSQTSNSTVNNSTESQAQQSMSETTQSTITKEKATSNASTNNVVNAAALENNVPENSNVPARNTSKSENTSTVIENKNSDPTIVLYDCENFKPAIKVLKTKADLNKANGRFEIVSAISDFQFSIDGINFQQTREFRDLEPGNYLLWVKDHHNCVDTSNTVFIDESKCTKEYKNSFSPSVEAEWAIPVKENEEFAIDVISIESAVVFSITSDQTLSPVWYGKNLQNAAVPEGLYKAVVKYKGKETCVYNVTIIK